MSTESDWHQVDLLSDTDQVKPTCSEDTSLRNIRCLYCMCSKTTPSWYLFDSGDVIAREGKPALLYLSSRFCQSLQKGLEDEWLHHYLWVNRGKSKGQKQSELIKSLNIVVLSFISLHARCSPTKTFLCKNIVSLCECITLLYVTIKLKMH